MNLISLVLIIPTRFGALSHLYENINAVREILINEVQR
jgi:hypothetical protein